jgi:hypothetical protein
MLDYWLSKPRSPVLGIKGATDVQLMSAEIRFDDAIDARSITALSSKSRALNRLPMASR